jgi:hypothetical protein
MILILFLFIFGVSCQSKKAINNVNDIQSYEIPTKVLPSNCRKIIESLVLVLKNMDLKKISFSRGMIQTHWIDNTFSFFSKGQKEILDKSAKYRLFIKGKPLKNKNHHCKLTVFKNQKVKLGTLTSWKPYPSDGNLEDLLFSRLLPPTIPTDKMEEEGIESIEDDKEESIESIEDDKEESIESIEDDKEESIESIEGDKEESIETIEGLETKGK